MDDPDAARAALAAWQRERRRVAREHHPDHGGDPEVFARLMADVDARRPGIGSAAPATPPIPREVFEAAGIRTDVGPRGPASRLVSRGRRRARGATRTLRARLPQGWPGSRRYIDL